MDFLFQIARQCFAMRALRMKMRIRMSERPEPHEFDLISEAIIYYSLLLLPFVAWMLPNSKYPCTSSTTNTMFCTGYWFQMKYGSISLQLFTTINRLRTVDQFATYLLFCSRLTRKMTNDKARNLNTSCNTIRLASDANVQNAHDLNH